MYHIKSKRDPDRRAAVCRRGAAAAVIAALLLLSTVFYSFPAYAADTGDGRAVCIAELDGGADAAADAAALKSAISRLCPDAVFLYDYEFALDGFSFTVPAGDVCKLTGFNGALIYEANSYGSPEPLDASSTALIGLETETLEHYRGEGMVIAVIDVGFDLDHELFSLDDESTAEITEAEVAAAAKRGLSVSNWLAYEKTSPYVSAKIPFAYDYYYQTTAFTSTSDHGNHVAAIAAGNDSGATDPNAADGVASEAQLLLMNVGDGNGENINDANIYAALEDAIRLGADVINISLGRTAGFGNTDMSGEGYARVIKRAYELGIDVVCAAGNESKLGVGSNLDDKYGISLPLASDPDYSVISDPSTFPYSVSAAASVNSNYVVKDYITTEDGAIILYSAPENSDFTAVFGGKTLEYAVIPGLGEAGDYAGIDVAGRIALIKRGTLTFAEKVKNAAAAGAAGALIYDNTDSSELINMAVDDGSIPCAAIFKSDGEALAIASNATASNAVTMTKKITVVTGSGRLFAAPGAGEMADYSSWGVTTDLRLKPDVTAPGSYIYSAIYDGYATMSGTSMAAPHITGALAVIKQYIKTIDTSAMSEAERLGLARALLMSTAAPIYSENAGADYSPRLQGAGLVDLDAAVTAKAYAYSPSTLEAKLELGDKLGDTYKLIFTVKNISDRALDYYVEATVMTDGYEYIEYGDGGDWFVTGDATALDSASVKLEGGRGAELNAYSDGFKRVENIRIQAGETKTFTLDVALDGSESAALDEIFTSGWYMDGFVKLIARNEGNSDLSIPYMGFRGDWSAVDAFDEGGEFYSDQLCTGVISEDSILLYELGINILGEGEVRSGDRYIISINGDDCYDFIGIRLSLLRNCAGGKCCVTDKDGNVVYQSEDLGLLQKAYYDDGESLLAVSYMNLLWDGSSDDNSRYKYPDGEYTLTVTVWPDGGGEAQTRAFDFTVDTVKPQLGQYFFNEKDGRIYLHVTASDNTYLAALSVYEAAALHEDAGSDVLDEMCVYEADEDSSQVEEVFDVTDCINGGGWLYIELLDYAFNTVTYRIPVSVNHG